MNIVGTDAKEQQLLQILWQRNSWVTCQELADRLDISPRSVRYLISKINGSMPEAAVISSRNGYQLRSQNTDLMRRFASYTAPDSPDSAAERKRYIFKHMVIQGQIAEIDTLCDRFCISPLTFRNELAVWRNDLSKYGLYLKTKNGTLYVIGAEQDRKNFAMKVITDELKGASLSLDKIQNLFRRVRLTDIKRIVLGVFAKRQCYLDDYSLLTYVLHLALYIELYEQSATIPQSRYTTAQREKIFSDPGLSSIVSEIAEALALCYTDIDISWEAVADASMFMSTRIMTRQMDPDEVVDDIEAIVGNEVTELIQEIVESLKKVYSIEINTDTFMLRFATHIKNLLVRVENGMILSGSQFSNIKNECPFLYVLAVHISYIINQKMNVVLAEEEISYIALHIGVMLQETTDQQEKLVCAVVAPDYHVVGKHLCTQLSQSLGDILLVDTLITGPDDLQASAKRFDLVISAYPLNTCGFPCVVTGPFLNSLNLPDVRRQVEDLRMLKQKNKILSQIETYMHQDLVYINCQFQTSSEAIEYICEDLLSKGYVTDDFKAEIYKHERLAPSSYQNIAIAHTLSNNDISSFIALAILPDGVIWGANRVNIIFVISLIESDRWEFKPIFNSLVKITSNGKALSKMLQVTNYEELKEVIRNYCS